MRGESKAFSSFEEVHCTNTFQLKLELLKILFKDSYTLLLAEMLPTQRTRMGTVWAFRNFASANWFSRVHLIWLESTMCVFRRRKQIRAAFQTYRLPTSCLQTGDGFRKRSLCSSNLPSRVMDYLEVIEDARKVLRILNSNEVTLKKRWQRGTMCDLSKFDDPSDASDSRRKRKRKIAWLAKLNKNRSGLNGFEGFERSLKLSSWKRRIVLAMLLSFVYVFWFTALKFWSDPAILILTQQASFAAELKTLYYPTVRSL